MKVWPRFMVLVLLISIGMLVLLIPTEYTHAAGNTFYIAKDGNDSNPGTEAEPWLTIQKAADTLIAGDTVYIKSGTYNERVVPQNSGSPGNYIKYAAYPGDTVTIDGTGIYKWPKGLFRIYQKNYIKVSGLRIENFLGDGGCYGIYILEGCDHIIIEDNYINNIDGCGIHSFRDISNLIIDNNEVSNTNLDTDWDQEMISVSHTDTFVIKDNYVHRSDNIAIDLKRDTGNGEVYNNIVYNCRSGIYADARGYVSDIDIYQNVVHGCTGYGFKVATETGGTLENINIYNNIAYNNGEGFASHVSHAEGSHLKRNILVINNTFHNNNIAIQITDYGEHFENLIIRNNILSGQNWGMINFPRIVEENVNIDHNLITGTSSIYGDNVVRADPIFVNPDEADFHLQEDSPAIDNGSSVDAPGDDYEGNYRPAGAGYDIGAYEFGAEDNTAPTITVHSPEGNGVNIGAAVSVTFSEAMDKTSVQGAFSISPSVTGDFQWDGNKMIFIPGANLAYDTTYTVTISTDAKDLEENNLESPYSWAFTTIDGPVDSLDEDGSTTEPVDAADAADAADEPNGDDGSNGGSEGCSCRTAGGKAERPATGVVLMFLLLLVYLTRSRSLRPPYRVRNPRKCPE